MWPILFAYLLLRLCGTANVADQYLVYHVSNSVTWLHDGVKEPAKRGIFVKAGHVLVVANHAEAMLVGADGRCMLINTPGRFTFAQLKQRYLAQHNQNAVSAFFAYLFEKFLSGEEAATSQQKVAATVFRGQSILVHPADSSIVTRLPVLLRWKGNAALSYKLSIRAGNSQKDTILFKSNTFTATAAWLEAADKPLLVHWKVVPADSKQPEAYGWSVFLIPAATDCSFVEQELMELRKLYAHKPELLHLLEKDLRRMELVQL
ncbi:MAG: hypothetical protein ACK4E8_10010 [Lacibacter sp.]